MKHGYYVMGKMPCGTEFTYGKNETKAQAVKSFWFSMNSPFEEAEIKKTLRIVELVEKDITKEVLEKQKIKRNP